MEFIYFKIADKYNIIDHPNHRSSHTKVTIRGGGIIFAVGFLLSCFCWGWQYGYFLLGLLLISTISFLDDIKPTSYRIRIACQLIAAGLLFYQLGLYSLPLYLLAFGFVFIIGTINAVNFMDGINGITGSYGLLTAFTLYYINLRIIPFTDDRYLITFINSLLVFNFFNFRTKAKCFAGDVGSVSMAFLLLFFIMQLLLKSGNLNYLLLLLLYGLDTSSTIFFRILRKENIFDAHRRHFYQFLVNERKKPHLVVAGFYMLIQGIVNFIIVRFLSFSIRNLVITVTIAMAMFIAARFAIEGRASVLKIKR